MNLLCALVLAAATTVGPVGEGDPCSTEASTNVVFRAGGDAMKALVFSIACEATTSNTVQAAFGCDTDGDGVLQVDEAALTVGWRCGAWFVRDELSGEEVIEPRSSGRRVLDWRLTVGSNGRPKGLVATDRGPVFAAVKPSASWFDRRWNLARITVRGLPNPAERLSVGVSKVGLMLFVR